MKEYIETIHGNKLEVIDNLEDCYSYIVWNIGRRNFLHKNYIPLCQPLDGYNINKDTLKAFKMPSEGLAYYFMNKAVHKTVYACDIIKELKNPTKNKRIYYLIECNNKKEAPLRDVCTFEELREHSKYWNTFAGNRNNMADLVENGYGKNAVILKKTKSLNVVASFLYSNY